MHSGLNALHVVFFLGKIPACIAGSQYLKSLHESEHFHSHATMMSSTSGVYSAVVIMHVFILEHLLVCLEHWPLKCKKNQHIFLGINNDDLLMMILCIRAKNMLLLRISRTFRLGKKAFFLTNKNV